MNDISQKIVIVCESLSCNAIFEAPSNLTPAQLEKLQLPCGHPVKCVTQLHGCIIPGKHFDDTDNDIGEDERWLP